ncbi:MAG: GNAT family N-acetyltransferase [Candidatus Atribacteria bacterium]|nr:GNAT family N-acetyltransferase [Candidatus Atribacteria bacterium]
MITKAISDQFSIRFANPNDISIILQLIKELAKYENLLHLVVADEKLLNEWLFQKKVAEVIIGEIKNTVIGFSLFFYNFSTFLGKPGIYVEDVYVKEEYRHQGYGKSFFRFIAQLARERGCGRMEWSVLNWNEPAIRFYQSLGASPLNEWTVYRLTSEGIQNLAERK